MPARKAIHVFQRQRLCATVRRKIGHTRSRMAGIRAAAPQPLAELPDHSGIEIEILDLLEERIHVGVGIEHDANEKLRVLARKRVDDPRRRLQVAPLVVAHLRRIDVIGERPGQLRRIRGTRQALQVIVGERLVVLAPLHVVIIVFQMIVQVPLRGVAARVPPDAAVEDEFHGDPVVDREAHDAAQVVLGNQAVAAFVLQVEIRIEHPVARGALGIAHVEERHRNADALRARKIGRVGGVRLVGAAHRRAGSHHQETELPAGKVGMGIEQSAPHAHCRRRQQALARQHRFHAGAIGRDDRDFVPLRGEVRKITLERESRARRVRESGLGLRHVRSCNAKTRRVGHAVDTHLDIANAQGVERPAA